MSTAIAVKNTIVRAAARAAFVDAWANYKEEQGDTSGWSGHDLMDLAPKKTPAAAVKWARKLVSVMEKQNDRTISSMYWSAESRKYGEHHTSRHTKEPTPSDFGHYTAMQALGHGVSWEDDHPSHGFTVPRGEFYMHGSKSFDGYVSERR